MSDTQRTDRNQIPAPFRPKGSNADEWHLWLSYYADSRAAFPDVLCFLAVQIAEALDRAAQRGRDAGYQECMKEWQTTR